MAVSKEPASRLETFIEELGAEFPIVSESSDSMAAYGRTSYPSAFLIGPDGRVVWDGHPATVSESMIEEQLDEARILPAFTDELSRIERSFRKQDYGKALKDLEKLLERERLEGDDLTAGEGIRDWLRWYATSSLENAARDLEAGKVYEAAVVYERIADLYDGHDLEDEADDALDELLSDRDRKLEVKAGERLAKILAEIREEEADAEEALQLLRPLLSRKYEDTAAGKRAAALAEAYEAEAD